MVRTAWVLAGTFLLVSSGAAARAADADPVGYAARYIVFAIDEAGAVKPQYQKVVTLANPRPQRSEADLAAWLRAATDDEHVAVRLLDADGGVAFRETVRVPRWLRTEVGLHGDHDGGATEALVPMPNRAFVVRVPVLASSRLRLTLARSGEAGRVAVRDAGPDIDLDLLAADTTLPLAGYKPAMRLTSAPPPTSGNRADFLFMGDGYTAAQSAKFTTDSTTLINTFFNIPPYSLYKNYFITDNTVFTASNQSGADHPVCPDPDPKSMVTPIVVDTAFDATFCTNNIQRLLTINSTKVLAAAAVRPDHDEILVVVNDDSYGGAGGGISTISTHSLAVQIAQHEFGHTFSRLADEYTSPYPGFGPCTDLGGGQACEPNVTNQTNRALLKWTSWVLGTTPLPTPPGTGHDTEVGAFEGARYLTTGIYRPKLDCTMNHLGVPFCPICAQEFILRLYRGGWGVPAAGIDNIEPGSESPAPGAVNMAFPGSQLFSFTLLQPTGGTAVVSWQVNGAPAGGNTPSFNFTPPAAGVYTIKATTQDTTALVNPAMAGTFLVHSRTWTVTAGTFTDLSITKVANGPARDGQPLAYTIVARNAGPEVVTGATMADTLPAQITGATWTCAASAGSSCPASGTGNLNASVNLAVNGTATFTLTGTVAAGSAHQIVNTATITSSVAVGDLNLANNTATRTTIITKPVKFYTVAPCRLADTRSTDAPSLVFNQSRTFQITGKCVVPATAWAVSLILTVTNPTTAGDLRLYPGGSQLPPTSAINYSVGQTRANNIVIPLGGAGDLAVYCEQASGKADLILDVNGYFQ